MKTTKRYTDFVPQSVWTTEALFRTQAGGVKDCNTPEYFGVKDMAIMQKCYRKKPNTIKVLPDPQRRWTMSAMSDLSPRHKQRAVQAVPRLSRKLQPPHERRGQSAQAPAASAPLIDADARRPDGLATPQYWSSSSPTVLVSDLDTLLETQASASSPSQPHKSMTRRRKRQQHSRSPLLAPLAQSPTDGRYRVLPANTILTEARDYQGGMNSQFEATSTARHPICKFSYRNGMQHEGCFLDGVAQGLGQLVEPARNAQCSGNWKDGKMDGMGVVTTPDGTYTGEMLEGKASGFGTYKSNDGTIFEGNWLNGLRHGRGVYMKTDGRIYDAMWKLGKWARPPPEGCRTKVYEWGGKAFTMEGWIKKRTAAIPEVEAPPMEATASVHQIDVSLDAETTHLSNAYGEFKRAASPEDSVRARQRVLGARDKLTTAEAKQETQNAYGEFKRAASPEDSIRARQRVLEAREKLTTAEAKQQARALDGTTSPPPRDSNE